METRKKDMSWSLFFLYLIGFYFLIYGFISAIDFIYKPAANHNSKIQNATSLPANK